MATSSYPAYDLQGPALWFSSRCQSLSFTNPNHLSSTIYLSTPHHSPRFLRTNKTLTLAKRCSHTMAISPSNFHRPFGIRSSGRPLVPVPSVRSPRYCDHEYFSNLYLHTEYCTMLYRPCRARCHYTRHLMTAPLAHNTAF